MLLIITEKNDIPSTRFISLIKSKSVDYKVICVDEKDVNIDFDINANKLYLDNIDFEKFSAIWFRRVNFHSYIFANNPKFNKTNSRVFEYLSCEKQKLFDFVLEFLYKNCKKVIGNPKYLSVNKLNILLLAKEIGFKIPHTQIVNKKKSLTINKVISKPIGEIFFENINGKIYQTFTETVKKNELSESFFYSLFQENIQKKFESKVIYFNGITYSVVYFTQMSKSTKNDSRNYTSLDEIKICPFTIPYDVESKLNELFKKLDLNFGIVDFIIDKNNEFVFLELNPVGQFEDIVSNGNYSLYQDMLNYLLD